MLAPKLLRENFLFVKKCLENRQINPELLAEWLRLDAEYRENLQSIEKLKASRNANKPKGKPSPEQLEELQQLSIEIKNKDEKLKIIENKVMDLALYLPNIHSDDTPIGDNEEANKEIAVWGDLPKFDFEPKSHDDLGQNLDILDFARGAKLSGSRFTTYKGYGAGLERSLINFMINTHVENGYQEILPPFLVTSQSMTGAGQLPKFAGDAYKCSMDDFYLIPTAEVPLTNMYRDEILKEEQLPLLMTAYTPCFRREAGSYGKDTSGLIRQHQFNKVELVIYSKPEDSAKMLESLTLEAELILQKLELPYRKMKLCSGDLGFAASKTYDLEVFFPSQNKYREISSCSNCLDFQSRRIKIRYRDQDRKTNYIHTLNGSALAVGRTFAAILENYQQKDGSIIVPDVLKDFMKLEIIK